MTKDYFNQSSESCIAIINNFQFNDDKTLINAVEDLNQNIGFFLTEETSSCDFNICNTLISDLEARVNAFDQAKSCNNLYLQGIIKEGIKNDINSSDAKGIIDNIIEQEKEVLIHHSNAKEKPSLTINLENTESGLDIEINNSSTLSPKSPMPSPKSLQETIALKSPEVGTRIAS